jgi:hypothetical protein
MYFLLNLEGYPVEWYHCDTVSECVDMCQETERNPAQVWKCDPSAKSCTDATWSVINELRDREYEEAHTSGPSRTWPAGAL